eukprot:gb/GEZN01015235.1/.p1 GENE.gb/GEZN01015235.1/~~gb/GEZN01015235.1/.p1  ORF type:complete len:189 (+),score=44.59 gb/GEZN01015235.1/:74-640(+)
MAALPASLTPTVAALLVLDADGKRVAAKYNTKENKKLAALKDQQTFEEKLFAKAAKTNARHEAQILIFGGHTVVYKVVSDISYFVLSNLTENEILLLAVLNSFMEATENLLGEALNKRALLVKFDLLLLTMDEIMDEGLIVETNVGRISKRVAMKDADGPAGSGPLQDQTFADTLRTAKKQFISSFAS